MIRRVKDLLAATGLLAAARLVPRRPPRIVPRRAPHGRAERAAALLLLLAACCALAFPVLYGLGVTHETQVLGASLGLALLLAGAALIVVGRGVVVTEENEEEYPPNEHPEEQEAVERIVRESGDAISRKRLLKLAGGAAGGALGLALITPAVSLGPLFHVAGYLRTPWRRGRRLVDEQGKPFRAADIEAGPFYTAFPEGADLEAEASPLIVIRLPVRELALPPDLRGYDVHGIVAYSKICTHAGCAISMYRSPLYQPDEPRPALVCPCHYSTFDPATGGTVLFGPAGRRLPMLPLEVDRAGYLLARGNFDEPIGPSWWGVRMWKPRS